MAKAEWLNTSPASGSGNGTIANSANAHTGRVARSTIVTVTGTGVTTPATYNVIQTPLAEFASFDGGASISAPKSGGAVTITGKSNSTKLVFSLLTDAGDIELPVSFTAAGLTIQTSSGVITGDPGASAQFNFSIELTLPENTAITSRTRTIKVTANGGQTAQLAIEQAAGDAYLTVSPTEITIPQDGTAVSVTVASNTAWSVS